MGKIGTLAVALVGVIALLQGIGWLSYPFQVAAFSDLGWARTLLVSAASLLPSLAAFALAVFLFRRASRISDWYLPEEAGPSVVSEDLVRAGVVLLGAYCFVQGVPGLVNSVISPVLSQWIQSASEIGGLMADWSPKGLLLQSLRIALTPLAYLALGTVLLWKTDWVVGRALAFRPAPPKEVEPPKATCANCGAGYDPAEYDGVFGTPVCEVCKQPLDLEQR